MNILYNILFKTGKNSKNVFELMIQKKEFLALVFLNLVLQLGITYIIMERTVDAKKKYNLWLLFGSTFLILFALHFQIHPILKLCLFSLFSYIFGVILSGVKEKHNEEEIRIAIQSALSIFGAMFVTALGLLVGGVKLGYKFGIFLFFSLLALILFRLFNYFSNSGYGALLNSIGIVLFSLYVLYHTHQILQKDYYGDFVNASMSYYLDIVNLFTNLLSDE